MIAETSSGGRHALIMGASGVTGWAIVNQILQGYPQKGIFSKVTALTNRPLNHDDTVWARSDILQMYSGIDLMNGSQVELEASLRSQVDGIETVTDLYFYAYRHSSDAQEESRVNTSMLERAVTAVDHLSRRLSFVVLPSGTKAYGVHLGKDLFPFKDELPLRETLGRIPEPYASRMFYYQQLDCLKRLSQGRPLQWVDLRPDVIPGFVPNSNMYGLAQTLAVYLSLFVAIEGEGQSCPFPGSTGAWRTRSNDSPQDAVAQFSVFASLNPVATAGESFNVAGSDAPASWSERWPVICEWFNLKGTGPAAETMSPFQYLQTHRATWDALEKKCGLKMNLIMAEVAHGKEAFQRHIMSELCFDRSLDLGKMRAAGFKASFDLQATWWTAFERYRAARGIP